MLPPKARRKVLIVDDEPGICELLSEAIDHAGYTAITAADGREGFEKAKAEQPDLILLDVVMPVMNGWQMLEHLGREQTTQSIPVVMLTAKGETGSLFKSRDLKVLDYFIKPINIGELISFVRRYIDLRHEEE